MEKQTKCLECGFEAVGKDLTNHIRREHSLKSEAYTIKHFYEGIKPSCLNCGKETRYVAFTFKRYCKDCSNIAESEAGKVGGKIKVQWNKGKTREEDPRIRSQEGALNSFFGKKHAPETIAAMVIKKRLSEEEVNRRVSESGSSKYLKLLSPYSEYTGHCRGSGTPLRFECLSCNREMERYLVDVERGTRCHICFPIGSLAESEIAEFIDSLDLLYEMNSRKVIPPKEVDIWIPSKRVAIEHHGLYWHSGGKEEVYDKELHRTKRRLANSSGIRLIQFFSDEWRDRQNICKSMISHRLGMSKESIGARKLSLEKLDQKIGKSFFDAAHIDGNTRASAYFGLVDGKGNVVMGLSVRKPIQKVYGPVCEVARMATRINMAVPGGVSRLMGEASRWAKNHGFSGMMTYADHRFGEGAAYASIGMRHVGETGLNYWYTDGHERFDRFKYRAQPGISERDVALAAGVRQVHGSGNAIYLTTF